MKWSTVNSLYLKIIAISVIHHVTANRNMFSEGQEQFTGADVSSMMFGVDSDDIFPVAYFDVNADKLTDLIAVPRERNSIIIFLAMNQAQHLVRATNLSYSEDITIGHENKRIVSVRAGDFTGNGMADLMVTLGKDEYTYEDYKNGTPTAVDVIFCSVHLIKQKDQNFQTINLECGGPGSGGALNGLTQEPTVLDLNGDMVLDLVGEIWITEKYSNKSVSSKQRRVWFSESTKDSFEWITEEFNVNRPNATEMQRDMLNVSSNAFADIDGDNIPELLILTEDPTAPKNTPFYYLETYEIVKDNEEHVIFQFKQPPEFVETIQNETQVIGQPMMVDFLHNGKLQHLFPYCTNNDCSKESGIYVMDHGKALPLPLGSLKWEGMQWGFIPPPKPKNGKHSPFPMENFYSRALSFRVGDYNLDGFPDLLGVLKTVSKPGESRITRAVLFENVQCVPLPESPCHYNRTFNANFDIFKSYDTNAISASFYDIGDNGALDVILVSLQNNEQNVQNQRFSIRAFENEMNFDASFLKVMVLTGQECLNCYGGIAYGNILPGATIKYHSHNTIGTEENGVMVQTYRTSHMPLDLPSNVFGIGHSPNFIETLTIAISPNAKETYMREWKQIIPNSQIVVVPNPLERPSRWTMKLFLTPSDVVLKTFGILVGVCLVLATIVSALEFKERWEDRLVRQSEAHKLALWLG